MGISKLVRDVDDYINRQDWRVNENSNTNYSFAGLQGHLAGLDLTEYALETIYTGEMSKAHIDNIIHIHDMSHPLVSYCCGYGMEMMVKEGFNCGPNYVHSSPAKHLDALFGQINNFIFTMSGEWAGAQALNSVDTYCAAFIKNDNMTYDEVRRVVRQLVYNLNVKTRVSMQSPFTNFSVDLTVPDDLRHKKAIIGGVEMDFTYGDCQEEMNLFNEVLADVMMEGDALHNIFTFPIITYGITNNFPWNSKLAEKIFTFADEANSPYFSNFINSDMSQSDVRSMCCRLRLDMRELIKSSGGLFGSGDSTGSNGVVTLNLSRIGYMTRILSDFDDSSTEWDRTDILADNYKPADGKRYVVNIQNERRAVRDIIEHYPELNARINIELRKKDVNTKIVIYTMMIQYFMDIARKALLIKRELVQNSIDRGLVPYTKRYLGNIDNHFNTIGVNAGHEMCLNMLDKGIESDDGRDLAIYTLQYMLNKLSDYQEIDNGKLLWNLEATPAEGAGTRFAKGDRSTFKGIITGAATNMEFYTNSTQLPDSYTENIYEVFDHQEALQTLYTSGTVQHVYMNEPVHNWKVVQSLVKKLFTNYKLPYISISANITICPICGRLHHTSEYCPNNHTQEQIDELVKKGVIKLTDSCCGN